MIRDIILLKKTISLNQSLDYLRRRTKRKRERDKFLMFLLKDPIYMEV